jgi:hypothetical protein
VGNLNRVYTQDQLVRKREYAKSKNAALRQTPEGRTLLNQRAKDHYKRKIAGLAKPYAVAYKVPVKDKRAMLISAAKGRAKKAHIGFDLSVGDLHWPTHCPVLGIALCYDNGRGKPMDDSPSLDRTNPAKGYVKGNVVVMSGLANRIKNNCTDPGIFRAIANYVEQADG